MRNAEGGERASEGGLRVALATCDCGLRVLAAEATLPGKGAADVLTEGIAEGLALPSEAIDCTRECELAPEACEDNGANPPSPALNMNTK